MFFEQKLPVQHISKSMGSPQPDITEEQDEDGNVQLGLGKLIDMATVGASIELICYQRRYPC